MRSLLGALAVVLLVPALALAGAMSNATGGGGATPGGSSGAIQFNNTVNFGGFGNWDEVNHVFSFVTDPGTGTYGAVRVTNQTGGEAIFGLLGNNRASFGTVTGGLAVDLIRNGTAFMHFDGSTFNIDNTDGLRIGGHVGVTISGGNGLFLIGDEPVLYRTKLGDGVVDSSLTQVGLRSPSDASGKFVVCYDPTTGRLSGSSTGTGCD